MRDYMKEIEYCVDLLSVLYDVPPITEVKLSGRMTKTFGRCTTRRSDDGYTRLTFAKFIFDESFPQKDMYQIICHELAHSIDRNKHDHGREWQAIANEISDCYPFLGDIKRFVSSEAVAGRNEVKPPTTYEMYCCDCGALVGKRTGYRAPKWFTHGNNGRYRCNMCQGKTFKMIRN